MIAIGNDSLVDQFLQSDRKTRAIAGPKFKTNPDRVKNKKVLLEILEKSSCKNPLLTGSNWRGKKEFPRARSRRFQRSYSNPHVLFRKMVTEIDNPRTGKKLRLLGTPVKFSEGKTSIRLPPPAQGENTEQILKEIGLFTETRRGTRTKGSGARV